MENLGTEEYGLSLALERRPSLIYLGDLSPP